MQKINEIFEPDLLRPYETSSKVSGSLMRSTSYARKLFLIEF